MRTGWVGGLVVASALLAAVAPGIAGAAGEENFVPTADRPLRVVIVGDSHADDNSPGIRAAFRATGVTKAKNEFAPGLTTEFDWRGYWPGMLDARDPHVVVIEIGAWDRAFAAAYPAEYAAIVGEAVGLLTSRGAEIVWLGVAPLPPDHMLPEQRALLNGIYQQAADDHPRVHFVSTDPLVGGPNGEFVEYLTGKNGKLLHVRKPPWNAHFCPDGVARIAAAVVGNVRDRWDIPKPAKGWRSGDWIYNRRYVPPEPCS
jgi:hypothetical protein